MYQIRNFWEKPDSFGQGGEKFFGASDSPDDKMGRFWIQKLLLPNVFQLGTFEFLTLAENKHERNRFQNPRERI